MFRLAFTNLKTTRTLFCLFLTASVVMSLLYSLEMSVSLLHMHPAAFAQVLSAMSQGPLASQLGLENLTLTMACLIPATTALCFWYGMRYIYLSLQNNG